MSEPKDPVIRVSFLQPLLTFLGMLSAIVVAFMLVKSDVRNLETIQALEKEKQALVDHAQDTHTAELQALVERQTRSIGEWTAEVNLLIGAMQKRPEARSARGQ